MNIMRERYNKDYFESLAYKQVPNSQRSRNHLHEVLAHKKEGKLLEIGCGKGGFLKLAAEYFDVEGLDISKHAVNFLKRTFGPKVRRGDIKNESLPSDYYDVIVIFNVLEHLKSPELTISRIYDSLTKGGITLGSVPNNSGLIGRALTAVTNVVDKTHCSTYSPPRWRTLFEESGFRKVHLFGEVMLTRNLNAFIKNRFWPYLSFNLMFLCVK